MFDKLTTDTANSLGKIQKRSKRTIGKKNKFAKFLIRKGQSKLTTDEASPDDTQNDLEAT